MEWIGDPHAASPIAFLSGDGLLHLEILAALNEPTLDVERLILDRAATAGEFLEVLAGLPSDFMGDVLCIDERGAGFLSATGRGAGRVLYRLQPHDVRFYLAAHDLTAERLEMIA